MIEVAAVSPVILIMFGLVAALQTPPKFNELQVSFNIVNDEANVIIIYPVIKLEGVNDIVKVWDVFKVLFENIDVIVEKFEGKLFVTPIEERFWE
jgi:hypothetical protein